MNSPNNTKCRNMGLVREAMKLADEMLVMAQKGITHCEDDSCMLIYGTIRDCGYKIRRTVEHEQFSGEEKVDFRQRLH